MADASVPVTANDTSFLGHPKGLAYLAFTEAWERFSYYGMGALVVLYMVQELLLPGHIENVVGMATYRGALESVFGPMSTLALASQTFGFYGGLVYLTPLLGGFIADRWLGAKKTVLIGVLLMTAGHFAMAFEQSFLLAMLLLVFGSGCLKGNIAAQVGHLYAVEDESRRTRGYTIFSTGINIGGMAGPLVCGGVAQVYGWHYGFGTAGVFMLLACAVYLVGQKQLPEPNARGRSRIVEARLTPHERRTVVLLVTIMAISILPSIAYGQGFNVGLIWISEHVDLTTSIGSFPVPWFNSVDAFASVLVAPLLILFWMAQARRGSEPGDITKIAIAALILAASRLLLAGGAYLAGDGKASLVIPMLSFILSGIGFMWYWPTLLALISRRAPKKLGGLMMASVYLTAFFSAVTEGYLGTFYEKMSAENFWLLHVAIPSAGALMFLIFGPALKRAMDRPDPDIPSIDNAIGVAT
ncbi:peptide MFS transporter [Parasphingorhabdus sp.]|uniref:peptide MFS transporter n=1 Tax=Parasphingorhabdus sp. TaxID=2709688 RepID=UPI0030015CD6